MSPASNQLILPAGYRLHSFDTIDSTNAEALRRIAKGAHHGDVIWAKQQSVGRGRRGRPWFSPPGNLYVTLIVETPPERLAGQLAFVAATGAGDAVRDFLSPPDRLQYKWPNDLMVEGRKLGGILIEGDAAGRNHNLVAVGLGLNVTSRPSDLVAASLGEFGIEISVRHILQVVCRSFDQWYRAWRLEGFIPIREHWLDAAYGIGDPINVRFPNGATQSGSFRGIDGTGALILEHSDGHTELIATGEVFFASA